MVCILQHKSQITTITLESKVKVKYVYNLSYDSKCEFQFCFCFLVEGVHIKHNDCFWCVDYKSKVSDHQNDIKVKGQGQIHIKCLSIHNTNPFYILDGGCSYLAQ